MSYDLSNPIAERKNKTVYKDNDKTIKLFAENYSKSNILNEALNQARVEEGTDLVIPSLLEVAKIDNRWAIVSKHIEGIPLNKYFENDPEKTDEYLNWFVDIQLYVSSKTVPLLNRMKDKFRRQIKEVKDINENTRYELLQRLESMDTNYNLCHGDFVPSNIIIQPDGIAAVIDWAHVTLGSIESDAANTYLTLLIGGEEELANKYLEIFARKSKIDKAKIQRWIPIVAAQRKSKSVPSEQDVLNRFMDVVEY